MFVFDSQQDFVDDFECDWFMDVDAVIAWGGNELEWGSPFHFEERKVVVAEVGADDHIVKAVGVVFVVLIVRLFKYRVHTETSVGVEVSDTLLARNWVKRDLILVIDVCAVDCR